MLASLQHPTLVLAAPHRWGSHGAPIRVRVEGGGHEGIALRVIGAGGRVTAASLSYGARSDTLRVCGPAELTLDGEPAMASFVADMPGSKVRVVVEQDAPDQEPMEATGAAVMLVRSAAGVRLESMAFPDASDARTPPDR